MAFSGRAREDRKEALRASGAVSAATTSPLTRRVRRPSSESRREGAACASWQLHTSFDADDVIGLSVGGDGCHRQRLGTGPALRYRPCCISDSVVENLVIGDESV